MKKTQNEKKKEYEKAEKEYYSWVFNWWKPYEGSKANLKFIKKYISDQGINSKTNYFGLFIFLLYVIYELFFSHLFLVYSKEEGYDTTLLIIRTIFQIYPIYLTFFLLPPLVLVILNSKIPSVPEDLYKLKRLAIPWFFILMVVALGQFFVIGFLLSFQIDFMKYLIPNFFGALTITTVIFPKLTWYQLMNYFSLEEE